ncbi:mismatch repair endonuclease PMS2 [Coccinella septempunctata]|uniref:mismatch repair endonuclease PMS2 n=1 Tax=Coccinella septempunctata TaxID=41139 RepID=UPI001D08319A|nr:mismatch repair endonuclease PMS2 [Coccinella septempunctata]
MAKNENFSHGLIKPISNDVVHQICSGQVILTLAVAVKELVENSIDAGATIIDITLKEYGSESIEVCDNGAGVLEDNFQALTLKHYTSKIDKFSDLQFLETLGFRGEALSSLCALADLSILTKHSSTEQAKRIKYNKEGQIVEVSLAARQIGTSVKLENLFSTLPVRRKEFMKNLKREFNKMSQLLYAYCLVSKGIKFTCTNITNNKRNVVVATQGHHKVRENIISVFGAKQISSLIEIDLIRPNQDILNEYSIKLGDDEELPFEMEFLVSSVIHGNGRSSTDRQFFYVNSRPVEPTKIIKLVNQIYKQFNSNQYPFVYLNILVKSSIVDVNVTPDKRQIFLEKEKLFLASLKASLLESFKLFPSQVPLENQDISKLLSLNNSNCEGKRMKRSLTDSPETNKDFLNSFRKKHKSDGEIFSFKNSSFSTSQLKLEEEKKDSLTKISSKSEFERNISDLSSEASLPSTSDLKSCEFIKERRMKENIVNYEFKEYERDRSENKTDTVNKNLNGNLRSEKNSEITGTKEDIESFSSEENTIHAKKKEIKDNEIVNIILDTPVKSTKNRKTVPCDVTLQCIRKSIIKRQNAESKSNDVKIKFRSTIAPENNKKAEEELQKQLSKHDFCNMEVIGQFNLGFIITRLGNDLFIIDQHATDEKYNFEQLQSFTVLQKQVLVNSKSLELTAGNESILIENEEIFRKNGFHFKIDENAPMTKKVLLTAVPVSQNYVFGKDDIDEMLFMLKDSSHTMCRPSRVRAMFASRACRKSVMIGKSLSKKDMKTLVEHMGEIDQPWNCPHGRPTIRHLINMDLINNDEI